MALVKHSNKKNNIAFPSHSTIAETAGVSERTSKRAVKQLAKLKYIEIVYRKSKNNMENTSNLYRILVENIVSLPSDEKSPPNDKMARELKDLNKALTKDNNIMLACQNEPTSKDDDVSLQENEVLKSEIKNTVGAIDDKGFKSLIQKADNQTIQHYLSNWSKFGHVLKIKPVGFFIDLCINKRPIPEQPKSIYQSLIGYKVAQEMNYEQRKYDDIAYLLNHIIDDIKAKENQK